MNQILNTNLKDDNNLKNDTSLKIPKKSKFLNLQFSLSILGLLILISYFFYHSFLLEKQENFSNLIKNNYSISKLYSNTLNNTTNIDNSSSLSPESIIGVIKIPKLNLSYTFFSGLNDDLLKISPCRFYGDFPNNNNSSMNKNLCIAGHNYNNKQFFSQIDKLEVNDKIIIVDNFNNEYNFSVIKNYEVKSNDLSPIYENSSNNYELTLVTCNNMNNNRIIIKAVL